MWTAIAAVIWATYAAGLGFVFGATFEDDHTIAFILAFGAALAVTVVIERGPPRRATGAAGTGSDERSPARTSRHAAGWPLAR